MPYRIFISDFYVLDFLWCYNLDCWIFSISNWIFLFYCVFILNWISTTKKENFKLDYLISLLPTIPYSISVLLYLITGLIGLIILFIYCTFNTGGNWFYGLLISILCCIIYLFVAFWVFTFLFDKLKNKFGELKIWSTFSFNLMLTSFVIVVLYLIKRHTINFILDTLIFIITLVLIRILILGKHPFKVSKSWGYTLPILTLIIITINFSKTHNFEIYNQKANLKYQIDSEIKFTHNAEFFMKKSIFRYKKQGYGNDNESIGFLQKIIFYKNGSVNLIEDDNVGSNNKSGKWKLLGDTLYFNLGKINLKATLKTTSNFKLTTSYYLEGYDNYAHTFQSYEF